MSIKPLYFDRNENQYGPAPACFEVMRRADIELMSIYSRDFQRGVKSRLSERLAEDLGVEENAVLLGYGGEDILKQTVHCYLGKGEKIMIPSHSWWYYKSISDEVDGIKVEYPIVEGDEEYEYDTERMLALYREHRPRVVLISSPNNPTGNSLSLPDLQRLLETMKESVVVLDEAYWSFAQEDNTYIRDLHERFPHLLIVRTFSKYYALAGIRIGFAVMGRGLVQLAQFSARYLGYHRLSEEIALAALDSPDYYRDIAKKMEQDKEMFSRELGSIPGFKVFRSQANFVLVRIPEEIRADLKAALTDRGLIVKFMNEELLHSHMRITIGTQEQNRLLADAITTIMKDEVAA
ncbi:MAG: histidinol-phosphate aminotransferase family protein [Bacteroidetes bacterium]|nr:histidinol-phosphate aminotransferase family protein [Bacteroidota bacterium]